MKNYLSIWIHRSGNNLSVSIPGLFFVYQLDLFQVFDINEKLVINTYYQKKYPIIFNENSSFQPHKKRNVEIYW
ncbi:hypothetical protein DSECCO2_22200 [anaerobic digester metagenome]